MTIEGSSSQRRIESEQLARPEFNRAFVLMQYFGYLRRNPNDAPDGSTVKCLLMSNLISID